MKSKDGPVVVSERAKANERLDMSKHLVAKVIHSNGTKDKCYLCLLLTVMTTDIDQGRPEPSQGLCTSNVRYRPQYLQARMQLFSEAWDSEGLLLNFEQKTHSAFSKH